MDTIQAGQIVKFNDSVREFCEDLTGCESSEVADIMSQTFLVVDVIDGELEVEVMSPDGSVLRFGVHDLEIVKDAEV